MKPDPVPEQRLIRMRRMFDKDNAVLVEDYDHFTTPPTLSPTPDEPTLPSKAAGKSEEPNAPPTPKRS